MLSDIKIENLTVMSWKGKVIMKVSNLKIQNYRNIRDINIELGDSVVFIGSNNSGKTNILKAFLEKKSDNKSKNKLYVALTRSLDKLTILISTAVEGKYTKEKISDFLIDYI